MGDPFADAAFFGEKRNMEAPKYFHIPHFIRTFAYLFGEAFRPNRASRPHGRRILRANTLSVNA